MTKVNTNSSLRELRLRAGMTQAEVGERLGVTQATISNWENGKGTPTVQEIEQLASIVGTADSSEGEGGGPTPVGAWLNTTRVRKGFSVVELAKEAGVSVPTIYNLESGRASNPRPTTLRRIEKALQDRLPADAKEQADVSAEVSGVGELIDFDPHSQNDRPPDAGVYVLYDVSERPVYVGESSNIKRRIGDHEEKFWFRRPIVENAAYIEIRDVELRRNVEKILIKFMKSNAVINKRGVDR